MNGHILAGLLVVLGLSIGTESQLVCYTKDHLLDIEKVKNCAAGEKCAMYTAYKEKSKKPLSNHKNLRTAVMSYYKKNCLAASECNTVKDDTISEISYKVNITCCDVNLCNDAPPLRMTVWAGMATMMLFIFMFV